MGKKVLVICTSLRRGGDSETMADEFIRGAKAAGNTVEKVCLYDKTIAFCRGCLICQNTHRCAIHDGADEIVQKMHDADVLAFATPIYYYEMCGQMKTLLDRATPLFSSDYAFREVYLICSSAEAGEHVAKRAAAGLEGWIECFEKARLAGFAEAAGTDEHRGARNMPDALRAAFELGSGV